MLNHLCFTWSCFQDSAEVLCFKEHLIPRCSDPVAVPSASGSTRSSYALQVFKEKHPKTQSQERDGHNAVCSMNSLKGALENVLITLAKRPSPTLNSETIVLVFLDPAAEIKHPEMRYRRGVGGSGSQG